MRHFRVRLHAPAHTKTTHHLLALKRKKPNMAEEGQRRVALGKNKEREKERERSAPGD